MSSEKGQAVTKDFFKKTIAELTQKIEVGFRSVAVGFEQHDERFDKIDQRFDAVDSKLEKMDQRLIKVETDVEDIKLERTRYVSRTDFDDVRERVEILEKTTHSHAKGKRVT
jgi:hypothetical protein